MATSYKVLAIVLAAVCLVTTTRSIQAQEYSGRATGIRATVITGGVPGTTIAVSDTGPLPSTGGNITVSSAGFTAAGILSAGASTATTSGSGITSQSTTNISTLDVDITGVSTDLRVRADTIGANTNCTCGTGDCGGGSIVTNLRVGQAGGGTVITVTGAVNQTVSFTSGTQTVTIVINEQIVTPGNTTVNGLHITSTDSATGVTFDVVAASAYSDIVCLIIPTAAGATVSGRILTPSGDPVSRARVTLVDPDGNVFSAISNPFGYFTLDDVPVQRTYLAGVTHRQYTFESRSLRVLDNVAEFDFIAEGK
jgi:hypothetical protein